MGSWMAAELGEAGAQRTKLPPDLPKIAWYCLVWQRTTRWGAYRGIHLTQRIVNIGKVDL